MASKDNYTLTKETLATLKKIRANSSIGGKDKKKHWIIDKEEDEALKIVIDLLNDLI